MCVCACVWGGVVLRQALNVLDKGLLDSLYSQPQPQYHHHQQQQQQQHSPLPQYAHPGGYAAYDHAAQQQQQHHSPPPPPYAVGVTPSPVQPVGRNPFASAGGSPFHPPPPHAHPPPVLPYANGFAAPPPPYAVGVTPSPMGGDPLLASSPAIGTNPFDSISPAPAPPLPAQVRPPFSLVEPSRRVAPQLTKPVGAAGAEHACHRKQSICYQRAGSRPLQPVVSSSGASPPKPCLPLFLVACCIECRPC